MNSRDLECAIEIEGEKSVTGGELHQKVNCTYFETSLVALITCLIEVHVQRTFIIPSSINELEIDDISMMS
ncbi:hypothetical protein Syun_027729 [Stephania yunnanensis]|uniref:Uncharacterized protein n=1 Tax=Stephania yunnanensis TaxID=152371 RepID=A0AAP0HLB0_9MAGN